MKKSIEQNQADIIEEFAMFDDKMQKYEYIIDLGKELNNLPEKLKVDSALVKGCQSRVWLHAGANGNTVHFDADSDAFIVRGLVSILLRVFNDQHISAIINAKLDFIEEIGLQKMLSPTRANGLASMVKQMKLYAIALQTQQNA